MEPEESFEALTAGELTVPGVTRRVMFGRDTLLADGHPYAFRDGERVAVKLPTAGELVAAGQGVTPTMGSRAMRQWVSLSMDSYEELARVVAEARSRFRTPPPPGSRPEGPA